MATKAKTAKAKKATGLDTTQLYKQDVRRQAQKDFCSKVSMLKFEAGALGLFYTMQKLDDAMVMVGYEVAGTPGEYAKAKAADAKNVERIRRS